MLYIAPVITFLQPDRRGGFLYEDISVGYVMYVERTAGIDGRPLPKTLVGKGETVGVKISLGYKRNCWDLKYAIFISTLPTVRVTQGKVHVATLKTDQPIGLGAMSFTISYTF